MKRTCNGCRALDNVNGEFYCELGYKVKQKVVENVINIGAIPQEECPKPMTYDDYLKLRQC